MNVLGTRSCIAESILEELGMLYEVAGMGNKFRIDVHNGLITVDTYPSE